MRTLLAAVTFVVMTVVCALIAIVARLLGVREGPGSIYDRVPRWWAQSVLTAAGAKVVVHGGERIVPGDPHIFVSNHVSWYDVLALVLVLPQ